MIKLRTYQQRAIEDIRASIRAGKTRILLVSPPGAGKGTIIGKIMADTAMKGGRALFVVHRKELVLQTAERTVKQFGYKHVGFYMAGVKKSEQPCMFGSIQTIAARTIMNNFRVVIIDEAHRIKTPQYQELVKSLAPGTILIGFTATPFRTDKKTFEEDFDTLVQACRYQELVDMKFLVPTRAIGPEVAPNLNGVHLRGGEFKDDELFKRFNEERVYKGIVDSWLKWGEGRRTIVYCVNSTEHCEKVTEYFQRAGVDARSIHSKSPNRDADYEAFQKKEFPVLVNVNLFTEGISVDDVDCIVFAVATMSNTKYIQAATRASRPVWNPDYSDWAKGPNGEYLKTDALIIDLGQNTDRFGYVDDYDLFPFDLSGEPKRKGEAPTRTCPVCRKINRIQVKVCECGHIFPVRPKDKMFLDDAEFAVKDRLAALVSKWDNPRMSSGAIKKKLAKFPLPTPGLLNVIGVIKGFSPGWMVHTAVELNEAHGEASWIPFNPFEFPEDSIERKAALKESWAYFNDKVKEEGLYGMLKEIKKQQADA